jgi:hypothetical protein
MWDDVGLEAGKVTKGVAALDETQLWYEQTNTRIVGEANDV